MTDDKTINLDKLLKYISRNTYTGDEIPDHVNVEDLYCHIGDQVGMSFCKVGDRARKLRDSVD